MLDSIIIGMMDRNDFINARMDNIIYINPNYKTIQWIPRDLYTQLINNRINTAYRLGKGSECLINCLKEFNIDVKHCLCLLPSFFEECIEIIKEIKIPVNKDLKFFYPLHRYTLIEDGKKIIEFKAPSEILSGDRIHEWIGARYSIKKDTTDIHRISRQEILLTEIIKNKIDFSNLINSKNYNGLKMIYFFKFQLSLFTNRMHCKPYE
jgi:anionic cell wall polymer biosynthesis LytR-Cps2A-Psr (LCP) family protein